VAGHPRWLRTTPPLATAIVAHRGAWGAAAQNTLEAFQAAIALGVDMIEFDVRRTGDGRLVVCHDPTLDGLPLTGVRRGALSGRDDSPPRLEEVLALARDRVAIDIELKERGCVREVVPLLVRFGLQRCLLTSFHEEVVREAKDAAPALSTGLLVGSYRSFAQLFPAPRTRRASADTLVVHHRLADAGVLGRAGVPCLVWTVNDPRRLQRYLSDPRVAGVITDAPGVALACRASFTEQTELAAPY
jgi:glycerophosphoryl diester phosphodiesterase